MKLPLILHISEAEKGQPWWIYVTHEGLRYVLKHLSTQA